MPDGDRYISNQLWDVQRGTTAVKLSAGNFCLDFGTNPNANGVGAKLWTCYPGLTQQTFYYTDDNRVSSSGANSGCKAHAPLLCQLAIQGGTTCLDKTANAPIQQSSLFQYYPTQSWQCTTGNTNQVWTL